MTIPVVKFLVDRYEEYVPNHFGYNKEIWDIAPIAFLLKPDKYTSSYILRKPIITLDETYSRKYDTDFMRVINTVNRNEIFKDMFKKLNNIK